MRDKEKARRWLREYRKREDVRAKHAASTRAYIAAHPEKDAAHKKRTRESGRGTWQQRKSRYGLTREKFAAMLTAQNGCCGLCHEPFREGQKQCVDHRHGTNRARGILHVNCNLLIGHAHDNPEMLLKALEYLRMDLRARRDVPVGGVE
jgi:hypothetical protein